MLSLLVQKSIVIKVILQLIYKYIYIVLIFPLAYYLLKDYMQIKFLALIIINVFLLLINISILNSKLSN